MGKITPNKNIPLPVSFLLLLCCPATKGRKTKCNSISRSTTQSSLLAPDQKAKLNWPQWEAMVRFAGLATATSFQSSWPPAHGSQQGRLLRAALRSHRNTGACMSCAPVVPNVALCLPEGAHNHPTPAIPVVKHSALTSGNHSVEKLKNIKGKSFSP